MKRFPRDRAQLAFLDVLFNLLLICWLIVNPPKNAEAARPVADYVLYMVWDSGRDTDVDIYVQGPDRKVTWYSRKDVGYASIDRDDLGQRRDSGPINQEIVSFRSPPDGSYLVSVHNYKERDDAKGPGQVALELMNRAGRSQWHAEIPIPDEYAEVGVVELEFRDGRLVKAYPSSTRVRFEARQVP